MPSITMDRPGKHLESLCQPRTWMRNHIAIDDLSSVHSQSFAEARSVGAPPKLIMSFSMMARDEDDLWVAADDFFQAHAWIAVGELLKDALPSCSGDELTDEGLRAGGQQGVIPNQIKDTRPVVRGGSASVSAERLHACEEIVRQAARGVRLAEEAAKCAYGLERIRDVSREMMADFDARATQGAHDIFLLVAARQHEVGLEPEDALEADGL
jgi:hypothetical protein